MNRALVYAFGMMALLWNPALAADGTSLKAGVATRVITPNEPLWMAGYASRDKPAEGKEHDLYVKALALEDSAGAISVLVTSDLIGIPRELGEAVAREVQRQTGVPRERLMLSASHTHCGPVLVRNLTDMYPLSPEQRAQVVRYTDQLGAWMVETVVAALADRKPARLSYGSGTARFAMNRRQQTPTGFVIGRNPDGPVDHEVPVLRVDGADGKLRAVVFGYACHNTTLSYFKWCGDYAGFAQIDVEKAHPGALAMFWIGCGADANPIPRGTVEHAKQYGQELAAAVEGVLSKPTTLVTGAVSARYSTIPLAFEQPPPRALLQADLLNKNHTLKQRAERFLKILDAGGALPSEYPAYPIQIWSIGDGPLWLALGGEVVVDYGLRFKKELGSSKPVWVAGYVNDVMAYIPSERVLKEGGYEGDTSMIPYGWPSKWKPGLEEKIVAKVHELVRDLTRK